METYTERAKKYQELVNDLCNVGVIYQYGDLNTIEIKNAFSRFLNNVQRTTIPNELVNCINLFNDENTNMRSKTLCVHKIIAVAAYVVTYENMTYEYGF